MKIKPVFQGYRKQEITLSYAFLLPLLFIIGLFILVPVLGTLYTSFFRDVTYLPQTFTGLENYKKIIYEEDFWNSLFFTLSFTITAVFLEVVLGMVFALILNERFSGRGWLRAVVLIPWAIPTIVSAQMWKLIYDYNYGILNFIFSGFNLHTDKILWLGHSVSAFWAIVIAELWKTTPFVVIILLAGLQSIPEELYQQARIDGSSMWKRFWRITFPLVAPILVIALVFRTIDSIRIFDLVFILTGGGPHSSTETLSLLGYQYFLNDFGMGSAISIITFILAFVLSLLYIKFGRFKQNLQS